MANVVEVKIVVDNSQAVAPVRETEQAFEGFSMVMSQQEQDAQRLAKSLDLTGVSTGKLGGNMTRSLDSVRLLSQEFGLRLPRAIEHMLSEMPQVTSALNTMMGAMAGLVALQVFERVGEAAYGFYEKMFDVNAEMDKYLDKAGEAAQSKFIDESSLETARSSLESLNAEIDKLDQKRVAAGVDRPMGGFTQYYNGMSLPDETGGTYDQMQAAGQGIQTHYTKDDGAARARDAAAQAATNARAHELQREYDAEDLKNQSKINEAGLQGYALAAQKRKDARIESAAASKAQLDNELDQQNAIKKTRELQVEMGEKDDAKLAKIPFVDQNAGQAQRKRADAAADADARASYIELNRKMRDELIEAQNAAALSGLEGDAKSSAEKEQAIAKIKLHWLDLGRVISKDDVLIAAASQKFDNDRLDRLQKQIQAEQKAMRDAGAGGLTGLARIYAEHSNRVEDINTDRDLANNPLAASSARKAAEIEANNRLKELQDNFGEYVISKDNERVSSSMGADAKIEASRENQIAELQKKYDEAFKDQEGRDTATAAQHQQLVDGLAAIDREAAAQKAELRARNEEEDLNYDRQAAEAERRVKDNSLMGWVSDSKNAMAAIRAQRTEALGKLAKDQATAGLTTQEMEQRRTDIDRTANAQIAAQNQQMAHQIANDLESAFTNPVDFIKRKMQQMFMDIIANWIMQTKLFQSIYGQSMGSIAVGGPAQPGGGGIGGFIRGTFGGHPSVAGSAAQTSAAAASGAMPTYTSSGLQHRLYMGGGTAENSAGSTAASIASDVGAAATGIPGLYRRAQTASSSAPASETTGAAANAATAQQNTQAASSNYDVSSMSNVDISGDGGAVTNPDADNSAPNIANGMPGPSGNQSSNGGISPSSGTAAKGAAALGAAATIGFAGYEGYKDTKADFKSGSAGGTMKGMLGDAMAGAAIGSLFGPVGTLIGAGAGAAVGAMAGIVGAIMGEGGNLAARDYYKKSIFPQIESIRNGQDGGDYQGAVASVNKAATDGMTYMDTHWGHSAANWVEANYLAKEQKLALSEIIDRARGGGYAVAMSASQFHSGGLIDGFGSFGTGGDEGFIHARLGETVMNPSASSSHGTVLNAMNSGASPSDVARMYLAGSGGASGGGGGGTTVHHHYPVEINALDSRSFEHSLRNGGARIIQKSLNNFAGQYAGDGISG